MRALCRLPQDQPRTQGRQGRVRSLGVEKRGLEGAVTRVLADLVGWTKAQATKSRRLLHALRCAPRPRVTISVSTAVDAWARRCAVRAARPSSLAAPLPTLLLQHFQQQIERGDAEGAHVGDAIGTAGLERDRPLGRTRHRDAAVAGGIAVA